jgi:hypothetical protein
MSEYQDLELTGDSDLLIENFDLQLISGADAIAQRVWIRLRIFKGEWYLDNTLGMPYFQSILKKAPDQITVTTAFKDMILGTPGIASLLSFGMSFDAETRTMNIEFEARTTTNELISESGAL